MLPSEKRQSRTPHFCRIFNLPNISYNCDKCRSTSANSKTDSKYVDLQNKLSTISNVCAGISSSLSSLPNLCMPKSFSDIISSTKKPVSQSSHSFSTTYIPTNAINKKNHIVFEHLKPDQRHLDFVKSVFKYVDIDPNCITNISFKSHYANIDLISPCVRDSFLKISSSITSSKFSHIFIRPFLSNETILTGKIYFHAYKSSLTKHKCIFNRRSAHYELRLPTANDSRLDWKQHLIYYQLMNLKFGISL